jgi:hypothetical protein
VTRRDRYGEVIEEPETPVVTPKARVLERIASLRRRSPDFPAGIAGRSGGDTRKVSPRGDEPIGEATAVVAHEHGPAQELEAAAMTGDPS